MDATVKGVHQEAQDSGCPELQCWWTPSKLSPQAEALVQVEASIDHVQAHVDAITATLLQVHTLQEEAAVMKAELKRWAVRVQPGLVVGTRLAASLALNKVQVAMGPQQPSTVNCSASSQLGPALAKHGVTARLLVADAAIGAIIGKKGSGLQQLRDQFSANVTVPKDDPHPVAGERLVTVHATSEDGIRGAISCLCSTLTRGRAESANLSLKTLVLSSAAGHVIGKKGAGVAAIQEASNAVVSFTKEILDLGPAGGLQRVVFVTGSSGVRVAHAMWLVAAAAASAHLSSRSTEKQSGPSLMTAAPQGPSLEDEQASLIARMVKEEVAARLKQEAANPTAGKQELLAPDSKLCVVCDDEAASHAVMPCGHLCLCSEHADLLMKRGDPCPNCRGPMDMCVRIYA